MTEPQHEYVKDGQADWCKAKLSTGGQCAGAPAETVHQMPEPQSDQAIPVYTHAHDGKLCAGKSCATGPRLMTLHERIEAIATEYERVPRAVATGAVASMLREWLQGAPELQCHDSDCQAFGNTYAHQGEPGVFPHGNRNGRHFAADAVGANGRRILIRDDADGIYVGGALFDPSTALLLAKVLHDMAIEDIVRAADPPVTKE